MKHAINIDELSALGEPMAEAIEKCVHCGFCLPACPTYQLLGQEMDSPRGRIVLMKEVLEDNLDIDSVASHVDACLGCLACETACPSGVVYRDLISPFRARLRKMGRRSIVDRLRGLMVSQTLPFPKRFRWAMRMGRWAKPLKGLLPQGLQPMFDLLPDRLPPPQLLPAKIEAQGKRRARVALLVGCAQQVLEPDINAATVDVLSRNGVEVVIPPAQSCCGSLAWHVGNIQQAQRFAAQNLAAFPSDIDAIVTNAAGCGSGMQEYGIMLRGTPREGAAKDFSQRVCDVAAFLDGIGMVAEIPEQKHSLRVAYQDACHLLHGQGVGAGPRRLLLSVPGLELVTVREAEMCCGSAGSYNIDQPAMAEELGAKKARNILSMNPDLVASGNIGCITQLKLHLKRLGSSLPVRHTMQVLRDAYDDE